MTEISQLIAVADAYIAASNRKETTVSTSVFNDGKKLTALRSGAVDIGVRRFNIALEWFSANWPEGATWPDAVARPSVERAA
ncbi:hypothetical protein [Mesorhizobium sp. B2-1-2]|uniref:hypothetical protein n=1 Tax=Mesorhizobium sp. B2-1-2 TaxID=2589973 RepID=UPI001127ACA3|nr:hypothetical protein [Mesorhizobium sp. B2-1-2]TPN11687.1 hypothetical protein FJ971_09775 [Mesorhizobium sp. B2-1-2]